MKNAPTATTANQSAKHYSIRPLPEILRWCDSYSRIPTLLSEYPNHADNPAQWFQSLGEEWSFCDNIGIFVDELRFIMRTASLEQLSLMMTEQERDSLAGMPDSFTVYRGCYRINANGLSWTRDPNVARKFPYLHRYRRHGDTPLLLTATVKRSQCVLSLDRNEDEIICTDVEIISEGVLS